MVVSREGLRIAIGAMDIGVTVFVFFDVRVETADRASRMPDGYLFHLESLQRKPVSLRRVVR